MDERQIKHDTKKIVRKLLKFTSKHYKLGREEVEALNRKIIDCVHKNTVSVTRSTSG